MTGGRPAHSVANMTNTLTTYRRRGGVALLTGAALTVAGCTWTAVAQATGHVSPDLARTPLSHNAAISFGVLMAAAGALTLAGVVWLRRSDLPRGRWAGRGLGAVIAGTVLLVASQCASIPVGDQLNNATVPSLVWCGFAVASLLVVFGMIVAGVSTLSHTSDPTWRDHALAISGLASLILLPLESTSAVWVGVAVYALGYAVVGTALLTTPAGRRQPVAQAA